jgi:uncharacterized RDD family membrane protein YckC
MKKISVLMLITVLVSPYTFGVSEFIAPPLMPIPGGSFLNGCYGKTLATTQGRC